MDITSQLALAINLHDEGDIIELSLKMTKKTMERDTLGKAILEKLEDLDKARLEGFLNACEKYNIIPKEESVKGFLELNPS